MTTEVPPPDELRARRRTAAALAVLILAGLALRVHAAWQERIITDPDTGVVALMARDMAAGHAWPTFFSGQPYMGSLEPAFSALLVRLFGLSGFVVNLGTALTSVLLIPLLFAWGRAAGGRRAGLAAAAFAVCCTSDSFHYMVSPRGGYAALAVLTTALLWQAPRQAWRIREGNGSPLGLLLLGGLAGLAWWVHQLSIEVLASCALLVLVVAGRRLYQPALLGAALGGFLLGSAPFWIWNVAHDFETFRFLAESARMEGAATWRDFLARGRRWAGLDEASPLLRAVVVAAYAAAVGAALLRLAQSLRRRTWAEPDVHLLSALLLMASSYVFFTHSGFAQYRTARYMVPLVPVAGLLLGWLATQTRRGGWHRLAVLPLVLALLPAVQLHGYFSTRAQAGHAFQERAQQVADFLRARGIADVLCHFRFHAFNFANGGDLRFLVPATDHLVPHLRASEHAEQIAVLSNHGGVEQMIQSAGGSTRIGAAGSIRMAYEFRAPTNGLTEIAPTHWQAPGVEGLADGRLDTGWTFTQATNDDAVLELVFDPPQAVAALRLLAPESTCYPLSLALDGLPPDSTTWTNLLAPMPTSSFFWSGPRPFSDGFGYRVQARLPDLVLQRLRVRLPPVSKPHPGQVSELTCFAPAPAPRTEPSALPDLLAELARRQVTRLYADRWAGNTVRCETAGRVECPGERFWMEPGWRERPPVLRLDRGTALLVRHEDLPACRRVLEGRAAHWQPCSVPPWDLMIFDAPPASTFTNLVWLGPVCAECAAAATR